MSKKVWSLFLQNRLLVLLIPLVAIGIITRFIWLDRFPVGITHDETDIVLSGRYFYQNGTDASGTKFPLSIFESGMESGQTSIVPFLLSPYLGSVKLSLFNVRMPFVVINLLSAYFLYKLVVRFSKNKLLAVITVLVFLFSPWSFSYSRDVIEAPVSLVLMLVGIVILFSYTSRKIFWSVPIFLLAFFVYWGAMPVVLASVVWLTLYHYFLGERTKSSRRQHFIFGLVFLLFIATFFGIGFKLKNSTLSKRSSEIGLFTNNQLSSMVDIKRRQSIQNPLSIIYVNRVVTQMTNLSQKYLQAFSPEMLFYIGDNMATYRFGQFGLFYVGDAIFIILGVVALVCFYRKLGVLVGILAGVAPLSSMLNNIELSYYFRSFMLIPVIVLCIASGIWLLLSRIRGIYFWLVAVTLSVLYVVAFGNFLEFYFFEYPVTQQENNFLSERVLAKFADLAETKQSVKVITRSPTETYQQFVFYNNLQVKPILPAKFLQLGNISFDAKCPANYLSDQVYIIEDGFTCSGLPDNYLVIQNQKDTGGIYRIYQSQICNTKELSPWRRYNLVSDYAIENMTESNFCNRWINKL